MEYNIYTIVLINLLLFLAGSAPSVFINFNKRNRSQALNIFFGQIFFILVTVFLYSVFKSSGNTIMLLIPVLFLLFSVRKSVGIIRFDMTSVKAILKFVPLALLTTVICYLYVLPASIERDVIYYSKIAAELQRSGSENYFHAYNELFTRPAGLMPYHYFEMWLTALINGATGIKSILVLKYVVNSYLITVLGIGLTAICEHLYKIIRYVPVSLAILAGTLCLGGLGFLLSFKSSWDIVLSPWLRPNLILYGIGLVPLILSLTEKDYWLFVFCVCFICLISITAVPGIIASAFVFLAFAWIRKWITFKNAFIYGITITVFLGLYYAFYIFKSTDIGFIETKSFPEIISYSFSIWKATAGIFLSLCFRVLILFPVFIFLSRKNIISSELLWFAITGVVVTTGLFQLLSQMDNSYQINYIAYALTGLLVIVAVIYFLKDQKIAVQSAVIAVLFFVVYFLNKKDLLPLSHLPDNRELFASRKGFDPTFARTVAHKLDSLNGVCGYYLDEKRLNKIQHRYRSELTLQPGLELAYYTDRNNTVSFNSTGQVLAGGGKDKDRLEHWYRFFPFWSSETNPFEYFRNEKVKALLITEEAVAQLKDSASVQKFNVIDDPGSSWLFYYKN